MDGWTDDWTICITHPLHFLSSITWHFRPNHGSLTRAFFRVIFHVTDYSILASFAISISVSLTFKQGTFSKHVCWCLFFSFFLFSRRFAVDLRKESVPNGFSHSENYFCSISMAAFPFSSPLSVSISASKEQRELIIMLHGMVSTYLLHRRSRREAGSPKHLKPHTRRETHANNIVPLLLRKTLCLCPLMVLLGDSTGRASGMVSEASILSGPEHKTRVDQGSSPLSSEEKKKTPIFQPVFQPSWSESLS